MKHFRNRLRVWMLPAVVAGVSLAAVDGRAAEPGYSSGSSGEESIATTTERTEKEITKGYLEKEIIGIKPQAGMAIFNNSNGDSDTRAAMALIVEMNAVSTFYKGNRGLKNWYMGPSTGVLYSHLGNPSSNFFGTDPSGVKGAQGGSNFLIVPLNLKVGYLWPDSEFRFSVRAGGNFTYRSVAQALNFGSATSGGAGSVWRMYPNIGADIEMGRLTIRPDLTLTPGDEFFTGTIGYNISLG